MLMFYLSRLNLRSKLLKKTPAEGTTGGDVGWMVDCEIAELTKFANLGHYLPNIPSPLALGACYARERKI
jgi:hypothetical protein